MQASFKMDLLMAKAWLIISTGSTSGKSEPRMEKKALDNSSQRIYGSLLHIINTKTTLFPDCLLKEIINMDRVA
ncbi:hypothetical protein TURU_097638 [Turdus rufiventris]|nr:hypothetical protein TURU_097638 [Turdus rufiventris]